MDLYGWIIYNGYLPGSKFRDFAEWVQRAAAKHHIRTTIYKNSELPGLLATGRVDLVSTGASKPDFVVFADKDIYLAKQLELMGIPVFNRAETIAASDDKITSYQLLAAHHLPVPKTVIAPKAFYNTGTDHVDDYHQAIQLLGFPMIVKEAFGSFGEQVYLVNTRKELAEKIRQLQGRSFMLQEFIAASFGKDKRLHVVGDEVVAAMTRHSANDFRSNVTAGGTMQAYHPTWEEAQLAVAAVKAIGADFAGVDLLVGPDDTPIICEINSNAHIRNLFDCTGINAADAMIDYIKREMRHDNGRLANLQQDRRRNK
ncbi:ATP-grasp domain-containing protein [Lentibacillus salinarum]|uniref:RimK family alpha-L-glutamate ligase n=1 Tax=Lentibacillus salinarum TaxID=446820 RepID=A0ABW3ZWW5_9BACI